MGRLGLALFFTVVWTAAAAAGPKRTTPANDTPAKRQKLFRKAREKLIESNALLESVIDGTSRRPARDALRSAQLRVDALFASQDARGDTGTLRAWESHFAEEEAKLVESKGLDALVRHEILASPHRKRPQRQRRHAKGEIAFPAVGETVSLAQDRLHRPDHPAFDPTPGGANRGMMIRGRHLSEVRKLLGGRFRTALSELRRGDLWIDVGTGDGVAPLQYVQAGGSAQVIGVDLSVNRWAVHAVERDGHKNLRFRQGDIRTMRFGRRKAKLITDVMGAMSYTDRPDQVLRAYGRLLQPGGQVMMLMAGTELNTVIDRDGGGKESLVDFIGRARGFELEQVVELNIGTVVVARRTADRVVVPTVEMLKAADRGPPHRTFRVTRGVQPSQSDSPAAYERARHRGSSW